MVSVRPSRGVVESEENRLGNPPGAVDRVDFVETAGAWGGGRLERVEVSGAKVVLSDRRGEFPRSGTWTGPEVGTDFAFTEVVPSFNPNCPEQTGVRLD